MKKIAALLTAAALITLTSCDDIEIKRAEPSEDEQTASSSVDFNKVMEKLEDLQDTYLKNLEITASNMPKEYLTVPDDWEAVTENGLTLYLPPDTAVSDEARGKVYKFTFNGSQGEVLIKKEQNESYAEQWDSTLENHGDELKKAFKTFGLDYDGTKQCIYRNLLAITPEELENADKETRKSLTTLGGWMAFIEKAYDIEKKDCELFIFNQRNFTGNEDIMFYSLYFFDDAHNETYISISSKNEEAALRIAASAQTEEQT